MRQSLKKINATASIEQLPDGASIDFCGDDLSQSHLELRLWISNYSRIKNIVTDAYWYR
jgi:hypothetical protein